MPEAGSWYAEDLYILFIVKVPVPVQPLLPVRVQVPDTVLPATTPLSTSVFAEVPCDLMVMPKVPSVWPLRFPLKPKDPVSVSPEAKQGEVVVKLKLLMVNEPLLLDDRVVPKVKAV